MKYKIIIAFSMLTLSGCSTFPIQSYSPQVENINALSNVQTKLSVTYLPASFTDTGVVQCRGAGPVKLINGDTFTKYVASSLESELIAGKKYQVSSPKEIKVRLTRVDFETTLGNTNWYIDGKYTLGDSVAYVSTIYNDKSSYMADKACRNMGVYFPKAVAMHLQQLIASPEFNRFVSVYNQNEHQRFAEKLEILNKAFHNGVITEQEFEDKRAKLISDL
ncbi:SHOCT domain-containing protein [Vibrio sp. 10N]|uniref:SHOCT domain-containing protein n=1 Tax=Vibrio sp. 10N TaxID=3058938 RepID=UPI002813BEBD|nr:hypothetical protein VB10N_34850 [Vibrio sp. 10N]